MSTTDAYLAAVRSLIGHLPTAEREEILEDLSSQLNEEAAEPGMALEERLGTPSAFAAEFVESLGVAGRREPAEPVTAPLSAARQSWTDARPAWWMVRPFVIVAAIVLIVGRHARDGVTQLVLVALGAVVAAAAVAWSTRQGSSRGRWNLAWTAAGVASAAAVAVALLAGSATRSVEVRPASVAAIRLKCAMAAKDGVIFPAPDDPKFSGGKVFASPELPPRCRPFVPFAPAPPEPGQAPLDASTTTTSQPPTTTSQPPTTTSQPPTTTTP